MDFNGWTAILVCGLATVAITSAQDANEVAVAQGNNAFGYDWFKIEGNGTGNTMISPYSAATVLSMLMMGAEGTTLSKLAKGLHLPKLKDVVAKGFQSLIKSIQEAGKKNITLSTANRIYVDKSFVIKDDYKNTLEQYFYSDIVTTDFKGNPEPSRTSINQWVQDQTRDRIQNLLPKGLVTSTTRSVLVNAIYFKGNWTYQFNKKNTKSQQFHKTCNDSIKVDLMTQTNDFKYGDFGNYQVVQLNYQGDDIYMLIILPRDCNGIGNVLQNPDILNITDMVKHLTTRKVRLTIPKFKIEKTIEMNQDLKELDMGIILTSAANLSDISDEELLVSGVVQKTFIEVSEEGTEAAAATGAVVALTSAVGSERPIINFTADHPFVFVIVGRESQMVLFLGTYKGTA